ncbi:hypothetical protein BS47DRAFT_1144510 [Hydnum rufescens UP504]|uniref:Zn(2)-C6 fungal-type domain-containing protein n=1 Tax=Hydnum rufescens UP504 TaxID=1448309 RepID=A0A9P6ATC0_9AGAM|nr:hypothetical protein BS47DRAFT_1144510 [Hydnum rufescens UP504]
MLGDDHIIWIYCVSRITYPSCRASRSRKVKCDGQKVCTGCLAHNKECVYDAKPKGRGRTKSQERDNGVLQLQKTLEIYCLHDVLIPKHRPHHIIQLLRHPEPTKLRIHTPLFPEYLQTLMFG